MGADRARVSYNPRQQYRSVVMQQGRVTLEADWNESQAIVGEQLRHETLDIIGPAGTPDNGYEIVVTGTVPTPPFDFTVSAGTMYVGGVRLVLDAAVQYSIQSDWLDYSGDPDWIMPSSPTDEYIYLLVREQEVSAVEDSALREVALGGPDTAARTRMIQHIVRLGTQTTDCAGGLAAAETYWANEGLIFDPATMRLEPQSSLQVSFGSLPPPDPCEPEVTGGYLGADNQLIRVQITGQNTLVWGFDDASFLYRVTIDSTAQVLTLQSQPVDAFHQPQANQVVEVLRSAALLSDGEFVASATGVVQTLTSSYNQSTQQLTLPAALPASYIDPAQTPRAFLRVWQQQLTFTPGTPIQLGNTGVYVTLTTAGGAPFHSGDYWMIAVRPSTPTQVYPQSYLQGKGPDGPRMWACPLAAIEWDAGVLQRDADCRVQFCNLVEACNEGRGCCTVTVNPQDLVEGNSLQTILDSLSKSKFLAVRVCLTPGAYHLPAPLMIRHHNLTLEGCPSGAVLLAQPGLENNFLDGLVVIANLANVTIQGLQMVLPNVPFSAAKGQLAGLDPTTLQNLGGPALATLQNLNVSIGIRALACRGLSVRDCIFFYRPPEAPSNNFAVGILASSVCSDLTISGNRFEGPGGQMQLSTEPFTYLAGFMSAPVTALTSVSRVAPPPPPPVPAPAACRDIGRASNKTGAKSLHRHGDFQNSLGADRYSGMVFAPRRSLSWQPLHRSFSGGRRLRRRRGCDNSGQYRPELLLWLPDLRTPDTAKPPGFRGGSTDHPGTATVDSGRSRARAGKHYSAKLSDISGAAWPARARDDYLLILAGTRLPGPWFSQQPAAQRLRHSFAARCGYGIGGRAANPRNPAHFLAPLFRQQRQRSARRSEPHLLGSGADYMGCSAVVR